MGLFFKSFISFLRTPHLISCARHISQTPIPMTVIPRLWYGMVWYDMAWYNITVWYGMACHGVVLQYGMPWEQTSIPRSEHTAAAS